MKTVAFWSNQLDKRGTSVVLYDYAYYNETLLGNRSIILYEADNPNNWQDSIDRISQRFDTIAVTSFADVDSILRAQDAGYIHILKSGEHDGKLSQHAKNLVHCIFTCNEPHGEVCASISPWVPGYQEGMPVIPHMINLPVHNRKMAELNIPPDATVFGRYGGHGQFNIKPVHKIVYDVAKNNPNSYFLFANTKPFCPKLPNIIHLNWIKTLEDKVAFINTCDAMLWARKDGETFGLAVAEFSTLNKPVICTDSGDRAHLELLGDKAIIYDTSRFKRWSKQSLRSILLNFDKQQAMKKDWNAYRDYKPEKVMATWDNVFLQS